MNTMNTLFDNSAFAASMLSISAYGIGIWLKRKTGSSVANPLLVSLVIVVIFLLLTGMEYDSYKRGCGIFSYLLTPATVALAVPLYEQRNELKRNYKAVMTGIAAGTMTSLLSILTMATALGLSHTAYVSLLPKSITMPIGISMAEELGGFVPVTVVCIVVTGVLGNVIAEKLFRMIHIDEPIAKGIATGTASHVIGTAKAMEMGSVEGAMSSLSIIVAGLMTVIGASVFSVFL